jgi:hypothetical protein
LRVEVESATAACLVPKTALLEGELAEVHRAREVAKETTHCFFDAAADVERWWEELERGCQEQLEELTLLQTRGSELCFAIDGPQWVWNHLSERMQIIALHHTKMARELSMLRTVTSSAMEFVLGRSPDETFWVEVVDELIDEFQKLEEQPGVKICSLLLGPTSGWA